MFDDRKARFCSHPMDPTSIPEHVRSKRLTHRTRHGNGSCARIFRPPQGWPPSIYGQSRAIFGRDAGGIRPARTPRPTTRRPKRTPARRRIRCHRAGQRQNRGASEAAPTTRHTPSPAADPPTDRIFRAAEFRLTSTAAGRPNDDWKSVRISASRKCDESPDIRPIGTLRRTGSTVRRRRLRHRKFTDRITGRISRTAAHDVRTRAPIRAIAHQHGRSACARIIRVIQVDGAVRARKRAGSESSRPVIPRTNYPLVTSPGRDAAAGPVPRRCPTSSR